MKKLIFLHILSILLVFGLAPQTFAATVAEASTGHNTLTVEKYDLTNMSDEEREWFITFLKGNFFADGWEQISSDILSSTEANEREQQQSILHKLGFKIGREWCKGNDSRKINTTMLRKWGRVLKDTADNEPHLLAEALLRIDEEVNEILD